MSSRRSIAQEDDDPLSFANAMQRIRACEQRRYRAEAERQALIRTVGTIDDMNRELAQLVDQFDEWLLRKPERDLDRLADFYLRNPHLQGEIDETSDFAWCFLWRWIDREERKRKKLLGGQRATRKARWQRFKPARSAKRTAYRNVGDPRGWHSTVRHAAVFVDKNVYAYDQLGTELAPSAFAFKEQKRSEAIKNDLKTRSKLISGHREALAKFGFEDDYAIEMFENVLDFAKFLVDTDPDGDGAWLNDFEGDLSDFDSDEINKEIDLKFDWIIYSLFVADVLRREPDLPIILQRFLTLTKLSKSNIVFIDPVTLETKEAPQFSGNIFKTRQATKSIEKREELLWYCRNFTPIVTHLTLSGGFYPIEEMRKRMTEMANCANLFRLLVNECAICQKAGLKIFYINRECRIFHEREISSRKGKSRLGYYVHPHPHFLATRQNLSPDDLDELNEALRELAELAGFRRYVHQSSCHAQSSKKEVNDTSTGLTDLVKYVTKGLTDPVHSFPKEIVSIIDIALHDRRMREAYGGFKKLRRKFQISNRPARIVRDEDGNPIINEQGYEVRLKPARNKPISMSDRSVLIHENSSLIFPRAEKNSGRKQDIEFIGQTNPASITSACRRPHLMMKVIASKRPTIEDFLKHDVDHPVLGKALDTVRRTRQDWNAKALTAGGQALKMQVVKLPDLVDGKIQLEDDPALTAKNVSIIVLIFPALPRCRSTRTMAPALGPP